MKHLLDSDCVVDYLKGSSQTTGFVQALLTDGVDRQVERDRPTPRKIILYTGA